MLLVNDIEIKPTVFPDKTSQVWKLDDKVFENGRKTVITWRFENEGEFLVLAQLFDLLNKKGLKIDLCMPYLPYGRQDKEVSNTTTGALWTFSRVLNTLYFQHIYITDPHNVALTKSLFPHTTINYPKHMIARALELVKADIICYPDKGAFMKYTSVYDFELPFIFGRKTRDEKTGDITSYKLIGSAKDQNVLIIDDICDGGATFIRLAEDLVASGSKSVSLFVSHGIFSKGLKVLKDAGIQRIFTKDGEASESDGRIVYRKEI
jgi:ribose-phosphate pyrophosphokinase